MLQNRRVEVKDIRKYCKKCDKELDDFLLFNCKHCKEVFCIDHFLPENHGCSKFNSPLQTVQSIRMNNKPESQDKTNIKLETKNLEQNLQPTTYPIRVTNDETPTRIKKNKVIKISVLLLIMIILLSFVLVGSYFVFDQSLNSLKQDKQDFEIKVETTQSLIDNRNIQLNIVKTELEQINFALEENTSALQLLKSGDEYHLHNPTYNEVMDFLKNNKTENITGLIQIAKHQGIRCAYVNIRMENGSYLLIGFDTVDNGMMYLEVVTNYRVFPEVGKKYTDCVEGTPYLSSPDKIKDILLIW